jgi:cell division protein FtsX
MLIGMSNTDSLRRGLRRSTQQIFRERTWGATLLLLTGIMVLVQIFLVFLLSVNGTGKLLVARSGIQVEVLPTARDQDIQELYAELNAHPAVQEVVYITGEEAYQTQRARDPELISFLEEYNLENPFPDTFSVTLKSLDSYDEFAAEVQSDQWRNVIDPSFLSSGSTKQQQIRTLLEVTGGLRTLSVVFIIVAIIALFFVILEWVSRTAARRNQELLLEHLLGASSLAVVMPFVCEMAILLIGATIIATALCGAFLALLPIFMPAFALEASFRMLQSEMMPLLLYVFPWLLLIELIAIPVLSFAGTVIGVRKKMPASFVLFS